MRCKICKESDVIVLKQQQKVRLECKNGHIWFEDYIENGGRYKRPSVYKYTFSDILFKDEKCIYKKIVKEIKKNKKFYEMAEPIEKVKALMEACEVEDVELYTIMKKVVSYYLSLTPAEPCDC